MKVCKECKFEKHEEDFSWKNKNLNIKHTICKTCFKKKLKHHYQNNKLYYIKKANKQRYKNKKIVVELKSKPCSDCHQEYPYYVMDFDHRPGENKLFELGNSWMSKSKKRLLEEIAKCDVVCSNCHRIRTHKRQNECSDLVNF